MIQTACGLDCYDACKIIGTQKEGKLLLKGDSTHPAGSEALCRHLYRHLEEAERIEQPRIDGKEVSLEEALDAVAEAFGVEKKLLWRGSGNFGVMQEVTNLLMEKLGGTLTHGTLCDGAGDAGVLAGRGVNKMLPLESIKKAETVVVWGRNLTVTNPHMVPLLEGKKLIVIDPVKTAIAKKADVHLQITPRTDYYMAILLARFIFMEDSEDISWLEEFAPEFEDFYDYTREHRIKAILAYMDVTLGDMGDVLEHLRHKRVVFLVGNGVQKYTTGASTLHAIDSLGATLGLFGKEGCGVHYFGHSQGGLSNPFKVALPTVSKVTTPFEQFQTVLVQGGNPAESMPQSRRVRESLAEVENLIYFGLYENETSALAKIVIPAKNFLEKEDIRLSYAHHYVHPMHTLKESSIGVSEYAFTQALFERLGLEGLASEEEYLEMWLSQMQTKEGELISPMYEPNPYCEGFGEEGGEPFEFIEEYDDDFINTKRFNRVRVSKKHQEVDERFWLITPKSKDALNTQFHRTQEVEIHPDRGFKEGERVRVFSSEGEVELFVKWNEDLRLDSLLITSNTKGVNFLTPALVSDEGESACYQEIRVEVEPIA